MKKIWGSLLLATLFVLTFTTSKQLQAQGTWQRPGQETVYTGTVRSANSGKCLDVAGASRDNGANVQQWDCAGKPNQAWRFVHVAPGEYAIYNEGSGKALDIAGAERGAGANVQQWAYGGGANQRWRVQRMGRAAIRIVSAQTGQCLDVQDRSRSNGANVQQYNCARMAANQVWQVTNASAFDERNAGAPGYPGYPGGYAGTAGRLRGPVQFRGRLVNEKSGKCLDLAGQGQERANIQQWDCGNGQNQQWSLVSTGPNEVAIVSALSGKVLDVAAGSSSNGANVQQFDWNGTTAQRWRVEQQGRGMRFVNLGSGKCLDVAYESTANGGNVQQYDCQGSANQLWVRR